MSITLQIKSKHKDKGAIQLIKNAIDAEIRRLELAVELARKRLGQFEQKYEITSEHFILNMTAEDLEGSDDEYVRWAGEYYLLKRLEAKLAKLQDVRYVD